MKNPFLSALLAAAFVLCPFQLYADTWGELVASGGISNPNNQVLVPVATFGDSLYIVSYNSTDGGHLYRTANGTDFELLSSNGFGDPTNVQITAMLGSPVGKAFNGYLYFGTQKYGAGTEIWRTSDGVNYEQFLEDGIDGFHPNMNMIIFGTVYDGWLYFGTQDFVNGGALWRTDGVIAEQVTEDGLGDPDPSNNSFVTPGIVYKENFYVTTWNYSSGAEIWRLSLENLDTGNFEWVNETPSHGNWPGAVHAYMLTNFEIEGSDYLYMSTTDSIHGGGIWRSLTGDSGDWEPVLLNGNTKGFDDPENDRIFLVPAVGGKLYAGIAREGSTGGHILESTDGVTWTAYDLQNDHNSTGMPAIYFKGYLYAGTQNFWYPSPGVPEGAEIYRKESPDSDNDGLPDAVDPCPYDADCDDDGLIDGNLGSEDLDIDGVVDPGETDPALFDTDGDGISDGVERGLSAPERPDATNPLVFVADEDPSTTTDPGNPDSDGDGISDGVEDPNHNGQVDTGETDPNVPDQPPYPPNSIASAYGSRSVTGSGITNQLTLLLIPAAAVIFLRILRRKK